MSFLPASTRTGILVGSWPLGMPAENNFYRRHAEQVERLGYDLLFHGDHLFMYNPNPDALAVLAHMAACTERVSLGTGVLLPALREPVVLAKQLATIDYLSNGRLIAGVGVGGEIEQEWKAMQVPREERGERTDEYLALMKELWSHRSVQFIGRFRSVNGVEGTPKPVQAGGPPIWVGGRSDAALRRAARHDGWCAYAMTPRRIREGIQALEKLGRPKPGFRVSYVMFAYVDDDEAQARATAGRVLGKRYAQDFERLLGPICAIGTPDYVRSRVREYVEAGVQDILFVPQAPAEQYPAQIERLAELLELGRR